MIRAFIFLGLLLGSAGSALAQFSDNVYRVTATVGAGYSRFVTTLGLDGLNRNGFASMIRCMWVPEHLLSVGLETGYYHLYTYAEGIDSPEFGRQGVRSTLAAFPFHLTFSMRVVEGFEILLGSGGALLAVRTSAYQSESRATQWSTENFAGIAYRRSVSERIQVGGELRYFGIHKTEGGNLVFQVTLGMDIVRY